jgi:hypothetical protein
MAETETNRVAESLKQRSRASKNDSADTARLVMTPKADTLPDGRAVADLTDKDLATALDELGIDGVVSGNSREANLALFQVFLARTFQDGGSESVKFWYDLNDDGDDKRKEDE